MGIKSDYLVVGGGLAGTFASFFLSFAGSTILAEKTALAAEASGAAVGLVNPFMGRKARTIWRYEEAWDGFKEILSRAGCNSQFHKQGIWRPAVSEKQAGFFQEAAAGHPGETEFVSIADCMDRYPDLAMPFGALFIQRGGWVDIPRLLQGISQFASDECGLEVSVSRQLTSWEEHEQDVVARFADGSEIVSRNLILAIGYGVHGFRALDGLDLHDVKGQAIRLAVPNRLSEALPCVSGIAHIIPLPGSLAIGSTYEHSFTDLNPTPEGQQDILQKARKVIPKLQSGQVEWQAAGARVTVPVSRLPMVDRIPGSRRVWVFTGLGTKGILMAALLSRELPGYIDDPDSVPKEIRLKVRS